MKSVLAEYFNEKGKRIYQLRFESDPAAVAELDDMTSTSQGATAVQAMLVLVTNEEVGIHLARKVRSIAVDSKKPVRVDEVMSDLETKYGTNTVQWARAVFTHMKLKPPTLQ